MPFANAAVLDRVTPQPLGSRCVRALSAGALALVGLGVTLGLLLYACSVVWTGDWRLVALATSLALGSGVITTIFASYTGRPLRKT